MICPNCGISNDFGRDVCRSCGANLNQADPFSNIRDDMAETADSKVLQITKGDEKIVGLVEKAYCTSTSEYCSIFVFPSSILVVNHGSIMGRSIASSILSMVNVHQDRKKIDYIGKKQDILNKFSNVSEYYRDQIVQIQLFRNLTDASMVIELPPTNFNISQRN
jgi:hypothetical protein